MVKLNKIYTRMGDKGETGLGDGSRLPKFHPRIVALGEVDETNATIGIVRATLPREGKAAEVGEFLAAIQQDLFDAGADLSLPLQTGEAAGAALRLSATQVQRLETEIDRMNQTLPSLQSFVLPAGTLAGAFLHLARTIARRAERSIAALEAQDGPLNPVVIRFLNRLSDYLFVAARYVNCEAGQEALWIPGLNR